MTRVFLALAACLLLLTAATAAHASRPLVTAVVDPYATPGDEAPLAFERIRGAGARVVRIVVIWRWAAPASSPPAQPADPADPRYYWTPTDRQVRLAAALGLEPILSIESAPAWAEGPGLAPEGTLRPDPQRLAEFATALSRRYSGAFGALPRVRYFQAWNEPNLGAFLQPQFVAGRPSSPEWYREMVNRFSEAVHRTHANNLVIAGGLSPFGSYEWAMSPLYFMRKLLCMNGRRTPEAVCRTRTHFDIWATHPYSLGGPTHHAAHPDNVSIGDLPEMRRLLTAAVRAGNVVSARPAIPFWVTEFSWDSSPPDSRAVPIRLHARWVSEALYRMWNAGVSLVTWYQIRDLPMASSHLQSGLYFNGGESLRLDTPKPALTAFRFPFVAFKRGKQVFVWGRTPAGERGQVLIEHRPGKSWRTVKRVRTDAHGIFSARLPGYSGSLRGQFENERSIGFSLRQPPDLLLDSPFG